VAIRDAEVNGRNGGFEVLEPQRLELILGVLDHGQDFAQLGTDARQGHVPIADRERLQAIPQVHDGDEQVLDLIGTAASTA
jgi:hypothetical protein